MPTKKTTKTKEIKESLNNKTTSASGRVLKGSVVSDKMNKTRIVAITRLVEHPKYGKRFKVTTKFSVHDENNETKNGDMVLIKETKPMSKTKRWIIHSSK